MTRDELVVGEEYAVQFHKWGNTSYAKYEGTKEEPYTKYSRWGSRGQQATRTVLVFRNVNGNEFTLPNAKGVTGLAAPHREAAKRQAEYDRQLRDEQSQTWAEAQRLGSLLGALLPGVKVEVETGHYGGTAVSIPVWDTKNRAALAEALGKLALQHKASSNIQAWHTLAAQTQDQTGDVK